MLVPRCVVRHEVLVKSGRASSGCAIHVGSVHVTGISVNKNRIEISMFIKLCNTGMLRRCGYLQLLIHCHSLSCLVLSFAVFPAVGHDTCNASSRQRSHQHC